MLRLQNLILMYAMLALAVPACAPRHSPAPLEIGGDTGVYGYPPDPDGGIVVQPGDTLYAISRYHQTALHALIEANNLEPPFIIKPGQILRRPGQAAGAPPSTATPALVAAVAAEKLPPPASKPAPALKNQTVKQPVKQNAVTPPQVRQAASPEKPQQTAASPVAPKSDGNAVDLAMQEMARDMMLEVEEETREEAIPPQPKPAPARKLVQPEDQLEKQLEKKRAAQPVRTAALSTAAPAASPAKTPDKKYMRFLWPARGPILSEFGPKANGLHNDGINIAMPPNGPVMAAADGIVSYAGNALRGYGNLLLIRHEGGWVTAYAHNSKLLVEKGATVARGQLIARAGRSGGVPQDQLHFEIRQGARAVNPKPLLVGG